MATQLTPTSMQRVFSKIARQIERAGYGVLVGAPDTTHRSGLPMAEIMAIHEYGDQRDHVPERAPVRKTINTNRQKYIKMLAQAAAKAIKSGSTQGYERLGATAVSDVQRTIKTGVKPENDESTVRRKGSSLPLVDDGEMWQAYAYEVTKRRV